MTFTEKHIVESYSVLFEGLSLESKIKLIENLSKSLITERNKDNDFYKSFGALGSTISAKK